MKHLQKIKLSNIRRFGENVEISLAKGVTILLAPNGTGKTALFEAIELALTGGIRRLGNSVDPIIRDKESLAQVRLDFEDDHFCEVSLTKGNAPILSGNHEELFGNVEKQDLPFLLQLTHFLNQQGNNWFVNAHGTDGGSQLDHLSIGREATEVNQLIPAAKRAAGAELQQAQRDFDEINLLWTNWQTLLGKRNDRAIAPVNTLTAKADLLTQLNGIAVTLPDFPVRKTDQLLALKIMGGEMRTALQSFINALKDRLNELQALVPLPDSHQELTKEIARLRQELQQKQLQLEQYLTQATQAESDLKSLRVAKDIKQNENFRLLERKKVINQRQFLDEQVKSLEQLANLKKEELLAATQQQDSLNNQIDAAEQRKAFWQAIERRREVIAGQERSLAQMEDAQKTINSLGASRDTVTNFTLPDQQDVLREAETNAASALTAENNVRAALAQSETALKSLTAANDVIKQALALIASKYPQDRGDCPVCAAVYLPEELQRRMLVKVNEDDPGISALTALVHQATGNLRRAEMERLAAETAVQQQKEAILTTELKLASLNEQVQAKYTTYFPDAVTPTAIVDLLKQLRDGIAQTRQQLEAETGAQTMPSDEDTLVILSEQLIKVNERVLKLLEELNQLSIALNDALLSRNKAVEDTADWVNADELTGLILFNEKEQAESERAVSELQRRLVNLQADIKAARDAVQTIEMEVSAATGRLSELRSRWTNAKLTGEVNAENLSTVIQNADVRMNASERQLTTLNEVDQELSRLQVIEEELKIEQDIEATRGAVSEAIYQAGLEERLSKARQKLAWVRSNIEILNELSAKLNDELQIVYERLRSVNPLWQSLLKRIIVEPRFSSTALDSYGHYKKSHASVNVQLHESDVLVSHVASEAQITDLQLTFLLAMAHKYHWTPWKTLLLDDPTQHHDLVHASAVFDLLRDFVADYDFQIIMATHDPVQAKFFMRKLENDGIPVNIITLGAAENGVLVRMISQSLTN
ncbi:exonuclease SbcC [Mucilaginibacter pineti]|uniref:Exonuclease SbcC n=1 Tax=Mucilaginibacter pineti TaxID=1391627 RepID=A0A1G7EN17_9SPHI|nr:AAA family ATPase [Mucilaginibacter pineti]SDE65027.1 exonuclease SbcC [Mucilaginibacter pineti]